MKKILLVVLCVVMIFSSVSCCIMSNGPDDTVAEEHGNSPDHAKIEEDTEPEKQEYKYYEGTDIPTVDSVFDVELIDFDENPIYGPFSSETTLKAAMIEYAKVLERECGYSYELSDYDDSALIVDTSYGYLIIYGSLLSGTGYVLAIGLPE